MKSLKQMMAEEEKKADNILGNVIRARNKWKARALKARAERDALAKLNEALTLSRMTWVDMYNGMGMLPEKRKAMEDGTHEIEKAVIAARAHVEKAAK